MSKKRRRFSQQFKARVALEALKEHKTTAQVASEFDVHPNQVSAWKKELRERADELFGGGKQEVTPAAIEEEKAPLYEQIGRLQVELEWLKKNLGHSTEELRDMIDPQHPELSIVRQCQLLGLPRSTYYAGSPAPASEDDLQRMAKIDRIYTDCPFHGSRRIAKALQRQDICVNRKCVQRLMRVMGIQGMAPGPRTSRPATGHKIYPYLLRDAVIDHRDQVWSADITYIPLPRGFMYLTAVVDWYSRKVLTWELSNTMDSAFCVWALETALCRATPEIFNTDQGSQFTSSAFIDVLEAHDIAISMDGKGRALDNVYSERVWRSVKYEDVYLKRYEDVPSLTAGLGDYFDFYNNRRLHQNLDYRTPSEVYAGLELLSSVR